MKLDKLLESVAIHELNNLKKFLISKAPHPEEIKEQTTVKEIIAASKDFDIIKIERELHQQENHTSYTFRFRTIQHQDLEDDFVQDQGEFSQGEVKTALRKLEMESPSIS